MVCNAGLHTPANKNIFPVESICENRSERTGEKWYKGETERRVVQIRRQKEPEYQKDGRENSIKMSRDKACMMQGMKNRGEGTREGRQRKVCVNASRSC